MEGLGTPIRLWGAILDDASRLAVLGLERGTVPRTMAETLESLPAISEAALRTTGWELRNAFDWSNRGGLCVERALMGAMSLGERQTGSAAGALMYGGASDARGTALAVAYGARLEGMRNNFHVATLAKLDDGMPYVIAHDYARSPDGIMRHEDWLRAIHVQPGNAYAVPATHVPPNSPRGNAGIPALSKPVRSGDWSQIAERLASRVELHAAG